MLLRQVYFLIQVLKHVNNKYYTVSGVLLELLVKHTPRSEEKLSKIFRPS